MTEGREQATEITPLLPADGTLDGFERHRDQSTLVGDAQKHDIDQPFGEKGVSRGVDEVTDPGPRKTTRFDGLVEELSGVTHPPRDVLLLIREETGIDDRRRPLRIRDPQQRIGPQSPQALDRIGTDENIGFPERNQKWKRWFGTLTRSREEKLRPGPTTGTGRPTRYRTSDLIAHLPPRTAENP
tara:strand:+ start:53 stop:607 length:555 start_codon:yes stop_codon:yes gene_type:complete